MCAGNKIVLPRMDPSAGREYIWRLHSFTPFLVAGLLRFHEDGRAAEERIVLLRPLEAHSLLQTGTSALAYVNLIGMASNLVDHSSSDIQFVNVVPGGIGGRCPGARLPGVGGRAPLVAGPPRPP